ncbi:hypothetical protein HMPREF1383_01222, partial [Enterococcus faecium V689]
MAKKSVPKSRLFMEWRNPLFFIYLLYYLFVLFVKLSETKLS